jgi:hypothetical protein
VTTAIQLAAHGTGTTDAPGLRRPIGTADHLAGDCFGPSGLLGPSSIPTIQTIATGPCPLPAAPKELPGHGISRP